ncbi:hypothetical protein ACHHYP_01374 [Achlya hypogyna]|uniref:Mechanosensitive ion channel MscS domain-containing protein n=1 Tax=Achlya hypogyna TaxID=1202772 RepID=A0A1V9ZTF6_ACHHY|nr:hypothetical protein ACHHYP_01374 [Achlya hypogyna]
MGTGWSSSDPGAISVKSSDWMYVGAVAIVVVAWFFRVEMIRLTLRLLVRGLSSQRFRSVTGALREFENLVLHPLSYVLFVVFIWIALRLVDALSFPTVNTIVQICIGVPMLWTVLQFCKFLNVVIIRRHGWERSDSKDDSGKIMIVTEGIGLLRYILCAIVFYYFFLSQLQFDTVEIFTTIILVLELLFLLSSHTWFRNVMGGLILLIDEPIKSGHHVEVLGHEGVVEHMYLQFFTLRQYDQGLAIVPNGILLQHEVRVRPKATDARVVLGVHLAHDTPPLAVRDFVRRADALLARHVQAAAKSSDEVFAPATAAKLSLTDVLRRAVTEKKPLVSAHQPSRYWVTLVGLYQVQLVYYAPDAKFKRLVYEKRELTLALTDLLATMGLVLHEPAPVVSGASTNAPRSAPPAPPAAEAFTDDGAFDALGSFTDGTSSSVHRRPRAGDRSQET